MNAPKKPSLTPGFTLSLDCEGLWGMADQYSVVNAGIINDVSLRSAYEFVLRVLGRNNLKSTAAFVTTFASDPDAIRDNRFILDQMAELNPFWFANIMPALQRGGLGGWSGAEFYRAMSSAGHEMAWHGTTHLPLSTQTSLQAVELELELADRLFSYLGHIPRTIIFPRNQVGHLDRLSGYGFETYRDRPPEGIVGRFTGLANEWNIFDGRLMEWPVMRGGLSVSPAGYFLNWPSGVRALVPTPITVMRWKSLLESALKHGGYLHMWFHPHNLITAPAMRVAFEKIMDCVGELVKSGDMVNLTIAEASEQYKMDLPS